MLGIKLADLAVYLEPEAIFLSGGLTDSGDLLLKPTIRHLNKNLLKTLQGKIKVLISQLGANDAALLGAASLVWDNQNVKVL